MVHPYRRSENFSAKYKARVAAESLAIAGEACGISKTDMVARKRSRAQVAFARQLAMYMCHVVGRMSLREISRQFRRDRSTIAHACHAIEDRRDSPIFDKQVELLEIELRGRVKDDFTREHEGSTGIIEAKSVSYAS